MTHLTVVHISDLHFASPRPALPPAVALERAATALQGRLQEPVVLAISGDVTTGGNLDGYAEARAAIADSLIRSLPFSDILVCPGNHDITGEAAPFGPFNKFAFQVTRSASQSWSHDRKVVPVNVGEYTFLLINSSAHLDYRFGIAPIDEIRDAAAEAQQPNIVAVLHQSPVASAYGGSGLVNAYEFLATASELRFAGILHGHVHGNYALHIGRRPSFLAGVGSLAFEPPPNMNNQFAVYELEDGALTRHTIYRYYESRASFSAQEVKTP